jgi:hypothetical protein
VVGSARITSVRPRTENRAFRGNQAIPRRRTFRASAPAGKLTAVTIGAFLIILGIVLLIIDWTILGIILIIFGLLFGGFRRGRWY